MSKSKFNCISILNMHFLYPFRCLKGWTLQIAMDVLSLSQASHTLLSKIQELF